MIIITPARKMGIIFNGMGNILSRIEELASNEGITIGALERHIGASKGVLSRAIANSTDIQSKWIQIIVENYPHYSAEWLLAGRGEMLLKNNHVLADNPVQLSIEDKLLAIIQEKDVIIREQAEEIGRLRERNTQLEQEFRKKKIASDAQSSGLADVG